MEEQEGEDEDGDEGGITTPRGRSRKKNKKRGDRNSRRATIRTSIGQRWLSPAILFKAVRMHLESERSSM